MVLIPSYDRPTILKSALQSWFAETYVEKVIVVAEGSSNEILEQYAKIFKQEKSGRLIYKLSDKRLGSVTARNILLDLACSCNCNFIIMSDDDYVPPSERSLIVACNVLKTNNRIGAVGGKVIVRSSRVDGDFFLNSPFTALADILSKFTGYIFLDVKNGPKYTEHLTPFFILKKEVAQWIRYDKLFDTPTAFREESDLQNQIRKLNYKLLFYPNLQVIHLAIAHGGNRPNMSFSKRMFWKARNSTLFIWKWNLSATKRLWYNLFMYLNSVDLSSFEYF